MAAGDVAAVPLPLLGGARLTVGHWQLALYLGMAAGEAAAGRNISVDTVPFFWTVIFGKSIRYAGKKGGSVYCELRLMIVMVIIDLNTFISEIKCSVP